MSPAIANSEAPSPGVECPPKFDLRKDVHRPLPQIAPGTVDPGEMSGESPTTQARSSLATFNAALASGDAEKLASCFYGEQAFWKDAVALTSHLRTFSMPGIVAAALLRMKALRGIEANIELVGDAHFAVLSPVLMFIDCDISFRTSSPKLNCAGKLVLLPVRSATGSDALSWKIWVLSTWISSFVDQPEDERLLKSPSRPLDGVETVETDVFIVGAGSSGLMLAARLKAMGVESVLADRNAQVGDSWARRYDSLTFHVPTSSCEMPYTYFGKEYQNPHLLTKYEVTAHLQQYVTNFNFNIILSATVKSTVYNLSEERWTIKLKTADGNGTKTITSKHFVQATGFGCGKPYLPKMENDSVYKGLSLHSTEYSNPQLLVKQGVKSVAIIGSANTAFDVMSDCYTAGLRTTMIARSPTYVFPYKYLMDPHALGVHEVLPVDAADIAMNAFPLALAGQLTHGLWGYLASQEPDRYLALSEAGFPVLDSTDPSVDLQHHLVERGGGHYVDMGATDLIAEGKVAVRGLVQPVGYTETGLRLSDGSALDVDAVIWCTGFADFNGRTTTEEMLGTADLDETNKGDVLGPAEIAARLDASWGVDAEGEVRGMWKRHSRLDNYWVMGGNLQQQRWWSRPLAQQIRLALDGTLPPAYRDTPELAVDDDSGRLNELAAA